MLLCVGAGIQAEHLPLGAYVRLNDARWFLQTDKMPLYGFMAGRGLQPETMDGLYEQSEDFDELNARIAKRLVEAAGQGDAVFAAIGAGAYEPLLAAIMKEAGAHGLSVEIMPGVGYAEAAAARAKEQGVWRQADGGLVKTQAAGIAALRHDASAAVAVEEISDALLASEVKLWLLEAYREDTKVVLAKADEAGRYECRAITVGEMDSARYDHTSVLLVPPVKNENLGRWGVDGLEAVVAKLRAPDGCPWDREQTHESLKICLLEECYEVLDAIDAGDDGALCEELGDVLLQAVIHAQIAAEQRRFTLRDVASGICQKLFYRHPHVFGTVTAKNSEEVLKNWDQLKKAEKQHGTQASVLRSVPRNLPALLRAKKVQQKAARVGFDWDDAMPALDKVLEEAAELRKELREGSKERIEAELGDLLFSVVNVARLAKAEPEFALSATTDRFTNRFELMERLATADGKQLTELNLEQMDVYWERAKEALGF